MTVDPTKLSLYDDYVTLDPVGGIGSEVQLQLQPGVTEYVCVQQPATGRGVHVLAHTPYADATLTVKSSADNGQTDAYANRTVLDSASGTSSATPSLPYNSRRHFIVQDLSEPYLSFTADQSVTLTIRSRAALKRVPVAGVP